MKALYLLFSMLFAVASVHATSPAIASFLATYNISASTMASMTSVNITYTGKTYTELFLNSNPYLLINTTNPASLSFVTKTSTIASIINNNTVQARISSLGLSNIASEMTAYLSSTASSLNDCLVETGLANGGTCTLANYCNSCAFVPSCDKVLYSTGGPADTFGEGIMMFEQQYNQLDRNVSLFNSSVRNVSVSNINGKIGGINYAFSNISSITQSIYQNPIFPPPASVDLSQCNGIGTSNFNTSLKGAQWYCNAVGFCQFLTYNYTKLTVEQGLINTLNSNAPTASYVNTIAQNINTTEKNMVTPLLQAQKTSQLNNILNTTLANYTAVVNQSETLLTHISNESLLFALSRLQTDYSTLRSGYLSLNLTVYQSTLGSDLSNVTALYSHQEPLYKRIQLMADNNTGLLIAIQSITSNPNASALAFMQDKLNLQIGTHINNTGAISRNLSKVNADAKALQTIRVSAADLSRATDGPIATEIAKALSLPYFGAVGAMPLFATLPSLVIGLVILLIIYFIYWGLKKENKIMINRRTIGAWRLLFAIAIIVLIIYVGISYSYAAAANANAPIQDFLNAGIASSSQGIVLNGTVTPGMTRCANILYNQSLIVNQKTTVAYISQGKCTENGAVSTASACMNSFVDSGTPVIVLTSATNSSMRVYSMYGTALYASGSEQFMNSCYPVYLLR